MGGWGATMYTIYYSLGQMQKAILGNNEIQFGFLRNLWVKLNYLAVFWHVCMTISMYRIVTIKPFEKYQLLQCMRLVNPFNRAAATCVLVNQLYYWLKTNKGLPHTPRNTYHSIATTLLV